MTVIGLMMLTTACGAGGAHPGDTPGGSGAGGTSAPAPDASRDTSSGSPSATGSGRSSGPVSGTSVPGASQGVRGDVGIARSGGIAGHADRLSIGPDGTVTGTQRGIEVSCRLTDATNARLRAAVAQRRTDAPPETGVDRMGVSVTADGRTILLGEAQGQDELSRTVTAILGDLSLPPDQRTTCRH